MNKKIDETSDAQRLVLTTQLTDAYLAHVSKFAKLTLEEIQTMATSECGIDAVKLLELVLESEICKGAIENYMDRLQNGIVTNSDASEV